MQEFLLNSFDGTPIFVTLWDDVDAPTGVIQFVHGMGEYAGRYDEFARYLNGRGYIVFADDHRAHGRTESDKQRGNHKGNIFDKTVKDELFFREWLKQKYDLPVFLAGHSYGSFVCQAVAQAGTDVKAIALLGTGYLKGAFTMGAVALAPVWLVARRWKAKCFRPISDNRHKYKGDSGKVQWINSIPQRREAFLQDQYTHVPMSINFKFYMCKGGAKLFRRSSLAKLNPATAIAVFCGEGDPVGGYGKGAHKLFEMYKSIGIPCELFLYPTARHEVVYDVCAEQARADIASFFDRFVIYHQTTIEELIPMQAEVAENADADEEDAK